VTTNSLPARPIRVLFIDDDPDALKALEKIAQAQSWDAFTSTTAEGIEGLIDEKGVEVVVSDHWMPGREGIDLLASLKHTRPKIARVLMSSGANREMAAHAVLDGGAHAVIEKPWRVQQLVTIIKNAVTQSRSLAVGAEPDLKSAARAFKR
jgi:DNA-binding NtrC family response regulator